MRQIRYNCVKVGPWINIFFFGVDVRWSSPDVYRNEEDINLYRIWSIDLIFSDKSANTETFVDIPELRNEVYAHFPAILNCIVMSHGEKYLKSSISTMERWFPITIKIIQQAESDGVDIHDDWPSKVRWFESITTLTPGASDMFTLRSTFVLNSYFIMAVGWSVVYKFHTIIPWICDGDRPK